MSKYHKIRWNEQDNKEIARVVANFNAKISRLSKKNPELSNILPEKITTKQLKGLINTRQDLHRELNSLRRFSKRGSETVVTVEDTEYDLKITKWQKSEMNRRVGIINRKRKARLLELQNTQMTYQGELLGYSRGQLGMGKATEVALQPMNAFYRTMGNSDLKKRWLSILTQSQSDYFTKRDYAVRENYIKGLLMNYDNNKIQDIIDEIKNMDIKDFLSTFEREGGTFEFLYPDSQIEDQYINSLRATWGLDSKENSKNIINNELIK